MSQSFTAELVYQALFPMAIPCYRLEILETIIELALIVHSIGSAVYATGTALLWGWLAELAGPFLDVHPLQQTLLLPANPCSYLESQVPVNWLSAIKSSHNSKNSIRSPQRGSVDPHHGLSSKIQEKMMSMQRFAAPWLASIAKKIANTLYSHSII